MKLLPDAEVYENECKYMPFKNVVAEVFTIITERSPKNARVLDLMCGPGVLLGRIKEKRMDLDLTGVDIDKGFIEFAKRKLPVPEDVGDVNSDGATNVGDVVYLVDYLYRYGPAPCQEQPVGFVPTLIRDYSLEEIEQIIDEYQASSLE